jgi:hypothetical protein
MKTKIPLSILLSFSFYLLSSQVPQGFNYQAIARDASGNPVANATIKVKLSVLSDSTGFYLSTITTDKYIWEEEQTGVKTNAFGLFTLVFGKVPATKVQGSAASFSAIDWAKGPYYVGTMIANPTDYKAMGAAQLWSVPYSMVSDSSKSLLKGSRLSVVSSNDASTDALFEVKRKDGQTVFAVYPNAVNIYVPRTTTKGVKGGFAIGGFDGSKTDPQDYFRVTPDSVRIYIDKTPNVQKGTTKGGFAIGGFDQSKNKVFRDLFTVNKDSVRIYIDRTPVVTKGTTKGGFAIGGFDESKSWNPYQDLLTVSNDSIRMYINKNPAKGTTKGGFAIGGFDATKALKENYFNVETDTMGIINPPQNRILWYPQKNAFLTGRVLVENHDSVGVNSFASGFETKSVGNYSQSFGFRTISRGNYSTAIGYLNVASGHYSLALGYKNIASGLNSFAIGDECKAIGTNAFAFGDNSEAYGNYSYAMGYYNKAYGGPSYAFGDKTQALLWGSTTFGWYTKSNAEHSVALGSNTYSNSYCQVVLGEANDTTVKHYMHPANGVFGSYNDWYDDDPIFTIGNGQVWRTEPPVILSRSNAFIVLKGGKTGININYPSYMLDVNGEIASRTENALRFRSSGYSTFFHQDASDLYLLVTNSGDPDGSWNSFRPFRMNYSTGNVYIGSNNSGTNFSLSVLSDGNVGIGTLTPAYPLDVNGNARFTTNSLSLLSGSSGSYTTFSIGRTTDDGDFGVAALSNQYCTGTAAGDIVLRSFNSGNKIFLSNGAGQPTIVLYNQQVGIGISTPSHLIHLSGGAYCDGTGAWMSGSDRSYKKEIKDLDKYGLSEILLLKPISFIHKQDQTNTTQLGFIAQDVVKVIPELVNGTEGSYGLAYDRISVILVKAIKEQQKQIEGQQNQIESTIQENQHLKSELQLLQARMEQIEAALEKSGSK